MKNFYSSIALFLIFIFAGMSARATQLSGAYTIDAAGTASTTVFKNFTSFVTYLTSASARTDGGPANAAPFGVSGPVVVTVAAALLTYRARRGARGASIVWSTVSKKLLQWNCV